MIMMMTYYYCFSYPAVLVVPQCITDDTLLRVAKNHSQGRFPVALWKHSRTKAVLLRAGGFERSAVASFIKQGMTGGSISAGHGISSTSSEQEKFLTAIGTLRILYYHLISCDFSFTNLEQKLFAGFEFCAFDESPFFKVTKFRKSCNWCSFFIILAFL